MKLSRTKNASRNIVFGVMLKCYQIIVPFLMRTAMIYFMGMKYVGLNSLFTNVLHVLNIAELGVGSAMVYSMYQPIVDDDSETICALMRLYRKYYRIIGGIVATAGLIITPFIPKLIKSDVPEGINVYVLYLLNLSATVLSYWLFAYKNSILQAHQRNDLISKVTLITNTIQYVLQLLVIIFLKSYYVYILVMLVTQAATNITTAFVSQKHYPQFQPKGELTKEKVASINKRIRDLFTSKIGAIVVNSADTIVISAFLGLTVLAIYQNYYFILYSLISVITIVFQSCTAGVGNSIIVETKEKNFTDLKKFTFLIMWISGMCSACLLCLYQPFMEIWVGKKNQLEFSAVICFCIYYFIYEINQLLNMYKDAAGIWHEDRFRPLVTAATNLVLNIILVNFWGIYGVILSTVISMLLVGMPWLLHNLFTVLFEKKFLKGYLSHILLYTAVSALACVCALGVCSLIPMGGILGFIVKGIVCIVITNVIFVLFYNKRAEFGMSIQLVDKMLHGKLLKIMPFLKKKISG